MAVFNGVDNGLPSADMSPEEFAPTNQTQLQWPKWGQYFESSQKVGEAPSLAAAQTLLSLYNDWSTAGNSAQKARIWREMLAIHREQVFSIGLINNVPQPIVVSNRLRNVPPEGTWAWLPTSYFGVYKPDQFWFAR